MEDSGPTVFVFYKRQTEFQLGGFTTAISLLYSPSRHHHHQQQQHRPTNIIERGGKLISTSHDTRRCSLYPPPPQLHSPRDATYFELNWGGLEVFVAQCSSKYAHRLTCSVATKSVTHVPRKLNFLITANTFLFTLQIQIPGTREIGPSRGSYRNCKLIISSSLIPGRVILSTMHLSLYQRHFLLIKNTIDRHNQSVKSMKIIMSWNNERVDKYLK